MDNTPYFPGMDTQSSQDTYFPGMQTKSASISPSSHDVYFPGMTQVNTPESSNNNWDTFKSTASDIVSQRGLPHAVLPVLLGQAAIESARGTSNFAQNRNNYFGYEAYDSNPDAAKKYSTPQDSINDYLNLILGYKGVPEAIATGSPASIIRAIKANGYATDPNYVDKVMSTPEFQGGGN